MDYRPACADSESGTSLTIFCLAFGSWLIHSNCCCSTAGVMFATAGCRSLCVEPAHAWQLWSFHWGCKAVIGCRIL